MDRAGSDIDRLYKWLAEAVSLSWWKMQDFVLQFNIFLHIKEAEDLLKPQMCLVKTLEINGSFV